MLKGKTVVLGVTGGIAAYKIANLASMLVKLHCDVQVIMTENATNFIHPIAFETLTKNKCLIDTFDRNFQHKVEHVSIAKRADVVLIAPATANVIGKMANGRYAHHDRSCVQMQKNRFPCDEHKYVLQSHRAG